MKRDELKTALERHAPGGEPAKSHKRRLESGLLEKYLPAGLILDIGAGSFAPVVPWATKVDIDYPGYDGTHLPFEDGTVDGIFSSHCLEHVNDAEAALKDWFRTLRVGAHLFITVPHMYLYERNAKPPSSWNVDHLRFFTPGRLLTLVEKVLRPNSYRVRLLSDNDDSYDYISPIDEPPRGCYEIEMVIEKIDPPQWPDIWGYLLLETLDAQKPDCLAICGAGNIGQYIYELIEESGYEIACWTDRNRAGETISGRVIQTLDNAFDKGCTHFIITIIKDANAVIEEIKCRALARGFEAQILSISEKSDK